MNFSKIAVPIDSVPEFLKSLVEWIVPEVFITSDGRTTLSVMILAISPGLIQFRKLFWVGLYPGRGGGGACKLNTKCFETTW